MPERDNVLIGRAAAEERGNRKQGVEPPPGLIHALGDVIRRVRQHLLLLRASCFLLLRKRKRPVALSERHGPGIKPHVRHLGHAAHGRTALRTDELDTIHVRSVEIELAALVVRPIMQVNLLEFRRLEIASRGVGFFRQSFDSRHKHPRRIAVGDDEHPLTGIFFTNDGSDSHHARPHFTKVLRTQRLLTETFTGIDKKCPKFGYRLSVKAADVNVIQCRNSLDVSNTERTSYHFRRLLRPERRRCHDGINPFTLQALGGGERIPLSSLRQYVIPIMFWQRVHEILYIVERLAMTHEDERRWSRIEFVELGERSDDPNRFALRALPHRQGRAPVALARKGPVAGLAEKFAEAAELHMLRHPVDFFVVGNELFALSRHLHPPALARVV